MWPSDIGLSRSLTLPVGLHSLCTECFGNSFFYANDSPKVTCAGCVSRLITGHQVEVALTFSDKLVAAVFGGSGGR